MARRPLALGMLSGGLDSSLALALVQRQGIEVRGVNFSTGYCHTDHHRQLRRKGEDPARLANEALQLGARAGVPVDILDISEEYMQVVRHPKYGYGAAVNPCVDCRIFMMQRAKAHMEEVGADFVFTGEVLGQRPKSQHRAALSTIARESGLGDRLVRPLSAKLLAPTRPEREGLLEREELCGFHGRDRKPQLALAAELGVEEWPQPAGGCCYLTDKGFAVKVFDLFDHGRRDELSREDMLLCKVGRHFRVSERAKVIVGRFEEENAFLENFGGDRPRLRALGHTGPTTLVDGGPVAEDDLLAAARLTARYCSGRGEPAIHVELARPGGEPRVLEVAPYRPSECEQWLLR